MSHSHLNTNMDSHPRCKQPTATMTNTIVHPILNQAYKYRPHQACTPASHNCGRTCKIPNVTLSQHCHPKTKHTQTPPPTHILHTITYLHCATLCTPSHPCARPPITPFIRNLSPTHGHGKSTAQAPRPHHHASPTSSLQSISALCSSNTSAVRQKLRVAAS